MVNSRLFEAVRDGEFAVKKNDATQISTLRTFKEKLEFFRM